MTCARSLKTHGFRAKLGFGFTGYNDYMVLDAQGI
jgi:hypothetical protein